MQQVTIRRTLRDGRVRTWTGTLLRSGEMHLSTGPMGYVVIREAAGTVQHFAIDPAFATVVE